MADTDVRVGIVADTSGLSQVQAGVGSVNSRLDELRAKLAIANAELRTNAKALRDSAEAARQLGSEQAFNNVATAAAAFSETKSKVIALTEEMQKLGGATHHFSLQSASATRELIVLSHEILQGSWSRFGGSLMVMAEYVNGLEHAVAALKTPWGIAGIAGVAALGAIGYAAYQTIQGLLSVRDATDRLVQAGYGLGFAEEAAKSLRNTLSKEFRETGGTIRELTGQLNKLPADVIGAAEGLARFAEIMSGFNHEDVGDNLKEAINAAKGGGAAFYKFANDLYHLDSAMGANGLTLKEWVSVLDESGRKQQGILAVIKAVGEAAGGQGEQARKASTAWREYMMSLGQILSGGGPFPASPSDLTLRGSDAPEWPKAARFYRRPGGPEQPKHVTEATGVAAELTKEFEKQVQIKDRLLQLEKATDTLRRRQGSAGEYGVGQDVQDKRLPRFGIAREALIDQASKLGSPGLDRAFEQEKAKIDGLVLEHRAAVDKIIADRERLYYLNFERLRDRFISAGFERPEAEELARSDPQSIAQLNQWNAAIRDSKLQEIQISIDTEREKSEAAHRGANERVTYETNVLRIIEKAAADGLKSEVDVQNQRRILSRVQREATESAYRDFKEKKEQEVLEARGNADKIIAIYEEIKEAAKKAHRPETEISRLELEQVRNVQRAHDQAFQATEASISAEQRLGDLRIKIGAAIGKQQVAAHRLGVQEQIQAEAQLTTSIYENLQRRVEGELNNQALTREHRARLNDQLAELYLKDAEKQLEAQTKITSAIESENKKRVAALSGMFDSFGSTLTNAVTGALTGKPMQWGDFVRSMVGDVVKAGTSMLSQYAGKSLAPMLGVKLAAGEDSSLGSVLGRALGDAFGLTKETPEAKMDGVADKMGKAADASEKAAALQREIADTAKTASDKFSNAVDRFNNKVGGGDRGDFGAAGEYGVGQSKAGAGGPAYRTPITGDETADNELGLIRKYESRNRYFVGVGGTDLTGAKQLPSGFPDWPGIKTDKGPSHAAGAYQFQPGTWKETVDKHFGGYADFFDPKAQDQVAAKRRADSGMSPWRPYNSELDAALKRGEKLPPAPPSEVAAAKEKLSTAVAGMKAEVAKPAAAPSDPSLFPPGALDFWKHNQANPKNMVSWADWQKRHGLSGSSSDPLAGIADDAGGGGDDESTGGWLSGLFGRLNPIGSAKAATIKPMKGAEFFGALRDWANSGHEAFQQNSRFTEALKGSPQFEGKLYRGLGFNSPEETTDFVAKHRPGETVQWDRNYSTSKRFDVADVFADQGDWRRAILELDNAKGADLAQIGDPVTRAPFQGAEEVIVPQGARFRVKSLAEEDEGLTYRVRLEQLRNWATGGALGAGALAMSGTAEAAPASAEWTPPQLPKITTFDQLKGIWTSPFGAMGEQLPKAVGDVTTMMAGLAERGRLLLTGRSLDQATVPVGPGLEAAGGLATFLAPNMGLHGAHGLPAGAVRAVSKEMAVAIDGVIADASGTLKLPRSGLSTLSNKQFRSWANEELPDNLRFLTDDSFGPEFLPNVHPNYRGGMVSELSELNQRFPLRGPLQVNTSPHLDPFSYAAALPSEGFHAKNAGKVYGELDQIPLENGFPYHQLMLTKHFAKPVSEMQPILNAGLGDGWWQSNDWRHMITHEWGHLLDTELGGVSPGWAARGLGPGDFTGKFNPAFQDLKARGSAASYQGSYARTDPDEWFAEAFASLKYGDKDSKTFLGGGQAIAELKRTIADHYGVGVRSLDTEKSVHQIKTPLGPSHSESLAGHFKKQEEFDWRSLSDEEFDREFGAPTRRRKPAEPRITDVPDPAPELKVVKEEADKLGKTLRERQLELDATAGDKKFNIAGWDVPGNNELGDDITGAMKRAEADLATQQRAIDVLNGPTKYGFGDIKVRGDTPLNDPFADLSLRDKQLKLDALAGDRLYNIGDGKIPGSTLLDDFAEKTARPFPRGAAAVAAGAGAGALGLAYGLQDRQPKGLTGAAPEGGHEAADNAAAVRQNTGAVQRLAGATERQSGAADRAAVATDTQTQATTTATQTAVTATQDQSTTQRENSQRLDTTGQALDKLTTATDQNTKAKASPTTSGASGPDTGDKLMSGLSGIAGLASAIAALTGTKMSPLISGGLALVSALGNLTSKNGLLGSEGLLGGLFGKGGGSSTSGGSSDSGGGLFGGGSLLGLGALAAGAFLLFSGKDILGGGKTPTNAEKRFWAKYPDKKPSGGSTLQKVLGIAGIAFGLFKVVGGLFGGGGLLGGLFGGGSGGSGGGILGNLFGGLFGGGSGSTSTGNPLQDNTNATKENTAALKQGSSGGGTSSIAQAATGGSSSSGGLFSGGGLLGLGALGLGAYMLFSGKDVLGGLFGGGKKPTNAELRYWDKNPGTRPSSGGGTLQKILGVAGIAFGLFKTVGPLLGGLFGGGAGGGILGMLGLGGGSSSGGGGILGSLFGGLFGGGGGGGGGGNALAQNNNATDQNTQATKALTTSMGGIGGLGGLGGKSAGGATSGLGGLGAQSSEAANGMGGLSSGLGSLTSVVGLAAGAMLMFGGKTDDSMKRIVGGITMAVSALQMFSGAGGLGSLLGMGGGGGGMGGILGGVLGFVPKLFGMFFEKGGIVPSASGGLLVDVPSAAGGMMINPVEHHLPADIKNGVRELAGEGKAGIFGAARMVPSAANGLAVPDGKGGRLAVVHPGELILPAAETSVVLGSIGKPVASAAGGSLVGGGGWSAPRVGMPRVGMQRLQHAGMHVRDRSAEAFQRWETQSQETQMRAGDNFNFSISAVDSHSVARLLMNNGSAIVKAFNKAVRHGSPLRNPG